MIDKILIGIAMKILDYSSLIAFIALQMIFLAVPAKLTIEYNLPPAASLLILMEQVNFSFHFKLMTFTKYHSCKNLNV